MVVSCQAHSQMHVSADCRLSLSDDAIVPTHFCTVGQVMLLLYENASCVWLLVFMPPLIYMQIRKSSPTHNRCRYMKAILFVDSTHSIDFSIWTPAN
jgi:hypothetical protein